MLGSRVRNYKAEANHLWMDKVGLLIVDEAHLIGDKTRGHNLEVALKEFCRFNKHVRILFLSATIPNPEDLSKW